MHSANYFTRVPCIRLLRYQFSTIGAHAALRIVHSLLERVVLPSKYVVTVLSEAIA